MNKFSVAFMIYGDTHSTRDALTEEKYRELAIAFSSRGCKVSSVLYNDEARDKIATELLSFDAVLVWVNPIEQGRNRKKLDELLIEISGKGCFVSAHPEVILKMGTKDVLYKTKNMDWGGDIKMYTNYEDFLSRFPGSLQTSKIRVLKQYRGNGGNGIFKIIQDAHGKKLSIIPASDYNEKRVLSEDDFYSEFKSYFLNDGLLVDQEWNRNIVNGMVRCYLTGAKVAGFGYQEINALYSLNDERYIPPGKRYYFTENCGLFRDLKEIMEESWVPQMQKILSVENSLLPVIWDSDFFINDVDANSGIGKYTLCEINSSCVSPFPPSAIKFIVEEVENRIIQEK